MATKTKESKGTKLNGVVPTKSCLDQPYRVRFTIQGSRPILLHAYNTAAVAENAALPKGSKGKKQDNIESYVYRNSDNYICLPGLNVMACLIEQGKSRQDPRSPRKSARDLLKATILPDDDLIPFEPFTAEWDFLDERRVKVNMAAITRVRPGFLAGWKLTPTFSVMAPEYISPSFFLDLINDAGKYQGLGDFRPVFGRFACTNFEILED